MYNILKKRTDTDTVVSFLKTFKTKENIFVPYGHDCHLDLILAERNNVKINFVSRSLFFLWYYILERQQLFYTYTMNNMISEDIEFLKESVKHEHKPMICAASLFCLVARSKNEEWISGKLEDSTPSPPIGIYLPKFKICYNEEMQGDVVFQDLTFLNQHEKDTLQSADKLLVVTKDEQDLHLFSECKVYRLGKWFGITKGLRF